MSKNTLKKFHALLQESSVICRISVTFIKQPDICYPILVFTFRKLPNFADIFEQTCLKNHIE